MGNTGATGSVGDRGPKGPKGDRGLPGKWPFAPLQTPVSAQGMGVGTVPAPQAWGLLWGPLCHGDLPSPPRGRGE